METDEIISRALRGEFVPASPQVLADEVRRLNGQLASIVRVARSNLSKGCAMTPHQMLVDIETIVGSSLRPETEG